MFTIFSVFYSNESSNTDFSVCGLTSLPSILINATMRFFFFFSLLPLFHASSKEDGESSHWWLVYSERFNIPTLFKVRCFPKNKYENPMTLQYIILRKKCDISF